MNQPPTVNRREKNNKTKQMNTKPHEQMKKTTKPIRSKSKKEEKPFSYH